MQRLNLWLDLLRGPWRRRALSVAGVLLAAALMLFGGARLTLAQQGVSDFDHASTGFVLNGQHQNVRCETCHTNGVFKGTPKDCASCHGWNNPRAQFSIMPRNHIPTGNASCESCHSATQAQFGDASLNFSHANVVNLTCVNCHSSNNPHPGVVTNPIDATHRVVLAQGQACDKCHTTAQFTGPKYPVNHIPTASVSCESCHIGGDYNFKPSITNIHAFAPSTSTNCAQCHSASSAARYSTANMAIPSPANVGNHIPMGSLSCEGCHVGAGSSITNTPVTEGTAFGGSLFNHRGATVSCATCHGASVTPTTFYGVSPRVISDLQPAHVPATASCDTCHAGVPSGLVPAPGMTTFANSQFSHSGISSGCATCHGPGIDGSSFYGISAIIAMPPTSPQGAGAHLPTSTTCENCHRTSTPTGLVAASATRTVPGSLFQTPEPTAAMIHSDTSASCSTCHESGTWMGMTLSYYARNFTTKQAASTTLYKGFQTRPVQNGGPHAIVDGSHPPTDECSICHGNTNAFGSPSEPAGHIPYRQGVGCAACHNPFGLTTPPTNSAIHANIQSTSSNCEQCHSTANAALYAATTTLRHIVTPPIDHIPMGSQSCVSCHVGSNSSLTLPVQDTSNFRNSAFSHAGISTGCSDCHGSNVVAGTFFGVTPMTVNSPSPAHLPVSNNIGCEVCHANSIPPGLVPLTGYAGSPSFAGGKFIHTGITTGCAACHGTTAGPFKDVLNLVRMPATAAPSGHIPSAAACEACHLGSMPAGLLSVSGSAATVPGTGFANSPPNGSMIHTDVSAGCNSCHEAGNAWIGMSIYPRVPATKNNANPAQLYNGFHTRPGGVGTYSMADTSHPTGTGQCSQCHGNTSAFGLPSLPTNHIPFATGTACDACHVAWGTPPTNTAIHANIQNKTANCVQCHSTANAALYASTITTVGGIRAPSTTAPVHVPMRNLGCESCHTAANTMTSWTSFAGGSFSHTGMGSNCAECHGPNVTAFEGNPTIVKMPQTSPANQSSHIPSSTTCETCHLGSMPSSLVPANAPHLPPNSGFLSSAPNTTMTHTGVTGNCGSCHALNMEWMGISAYTTTKTAPFTGFHSRPQAGTNSYWVTDAAHPADDNCSSCHVGITEWSANIKPSNHIPTANVACTNCHTSSNFSTMPTLALIHANAPSSSTNCAQCHSAANAALYNTTAMTIKAPATNHIPMGNLGCESCHVGSTSSLTLPVQNGALFTNSAFSHSGITNGCNACHDSTINASSFQGTTSIVVLPSTTAGSSGHIPSPVNAQCETCHLGSMPATLVKAVAAVTTPGSTKFKSPTPTGAMIHTGVNGTCNNCHEAGLTWVDISLYPRNPSVKTAGATYTGFHTRPNSPAAINSVLDANHPGGSTDCSACHGSTVSFSSVAKPANHIPTSTTAQCQNCHTNLVGADGVYVSSTLNFAVMPTVTNIHAYAPSTTSNCAQCHSAANAATYAIPSVPFTIKSPASVSNHIPYGSIACETCHVYTGGLLQTPVQTGASFAGGKFSHAGFTTGCATCHGPSAITTPFFGVTVKAIPASSTVNSATTHIPYSAGCEACHAASVPSGLVSVTSTGAGFATPLTAGTTIHSNSGTIACMTCHERGYQWLGAEKYPRTPSGSTLPSNASSTTVYKGFQTRPGITGIAPYGYSSSNHTLDTALNNGDCSQCHAGTTQFTAEGKPAGHMPTTVTTCSTCHGADYSVAGLTTSLPTLHTNVTYGALVAATTANMASKTCGTCHTVGTGGTSGTAPFAGCATQAACTSPPPISYQPTTTGLHPVHVPIGTSATLTVDCNGCHTSVTSFAGVNMKNSTMHTSVNGVAKVQCMACHERGLAFYGVNNLKVRPNGHHTGQDCNGSGCHTYNGGFRALVKPVMRGASVSPDMGRLRPTIQGTKPSRGSLGNSYDHKGVAAGQCKTCHDGKSASGMPARHLMVSTSCDTCHRPTTWLPAQFNHNGVSPNTCQACHNGMGASGRPQGHFNTTRSCDYCHKNMSWTPVNYSHLSPLYVPSPDKLTCVSCHETNGEMMRRQLRGLNRTKPIPVGQ